MNDGQGQPPQRKTRSGSEKRQRGVMNKFRSTFAERAEMRANAAAAGLAFGSFMRSLGCAQPTTRPVRSLEPAVAELRRYKGELGKIGGNLAQFLRLANCGEIIPPDDLAPTVQEVRALVEALNAALEGKL